MHRARGMRSTVTPPSPPRADAAGAAPSAVSDTQSRLAYDRTHLANERTFAAWLRTGLSVAAGGIAVAHLVPEPARDSWIALLLGASFVVLGVAVIGYGAREFARVAAALGRESGRPSPASVAAAYGLTGIVGALLLAVLVFLWSHRGVVRADANGAGATPGRASVIGERPASP